MINIPEVTDLHRAMVIRWHAQDVDNPYEGFMALACEQFSFNFLLWHEEDIARSPDVGDAKIAEVKRKIDGYNQNGHGDYQLDINGTPGQFEVLLAQVGADVVTITVTSADAADAAEVADLVVSSLEEA